MINQLSWIETRPNKQYLEDLFDSPQPLHFQSWWDTHHMEYILSIYTIIAYCTKINGKKIKPLIKICYH